MIKMYTSESNDSKEQFKTPKTDVINTLLNYSKSLEVLKSEKRKPEVLKTVEVILN